MVNIIPDFSLFVRSRTLICPSVSLSVAIGRVRARISQALLFFDYFFKLPQLDLRDTEYMVCMLLKVDSIPRRMLQLVSDVTGGIPLYIEKLVHSLQVSCWVRLEDSNTLPGGGKGKRVRLHLTKFITLMSHIISLTSNCSHWYHL